MGAPVSGAAHRRLWESLMAILALALLLAGCGAPSANGPPSQQTPTVTSAPVTSPTAAPRPSRTPAPTPTRTHPPTSPTVSLSASNTPTPSQSASDTSIPSQSASDAATPPATASPTAAPVTTTTPPTTAPPATATTLPTVVSPTAPPATASATGASATASPTTPPATATPSVTPRSASPTSLAAATATTMATATATVTSAPTATPAPPTIAPTVATGVARLAARGPVSAPLPGTRPVRVGPAPTPAPTPVLIEAGTTAGRLVALTFDCGADRGNAADILDTLRRDNAPASFGVTGRWAYANPDLVRRMAAQGEQLMDHTYDHQSFSGLSTGTPPMSRAQVAEELDTTDALLRELTGSSTKPYYRVPYGDEAPAATAAAVREGFTFDIRWTVDSLGWEKLSAPRITARVLQLTAPGGIILMHVGAQSQDDVALPAVIDALRARGYRFVTVAGLLAADTRHGAPHPPEASSYRAVDPDAAYYPGQATGLPLSGDVVILDPGHGGDDPGTCYPYTGGCYPSLDAGTPAVLPEKAVALDLALYRMLPRLHALGADVYLTRTTAEQNPELEQRLQLANYAAGVWGVRTHALFVSVHLNGADDPSVDYSQALYAESHPDVLASVLDGAVAGVLSPLPSGGDHGVDTFAGHVLRRNALPATIVEPAFLTNEYPVTVPVSVTRIVTAASGLALRQGWRLVDPVVHVLVRPRHNPGRVFVLLHESFSGAPLLRTAITAARTMAISEMLTIPGGGGFYVPAPLTPTVETTPTIPLTMTYAISVSGAVSATTAITVYEGEGPWLLRAHQATMNANSSYDTVWPATFALHYAANDREDSIARGLVRGIAAFFGLHPLPPAATSPAAAQPRAATMAFDPVVPPALPPPPS